MIIKQFHSKNQFVIEDWSSTYFQSYNSMVCKIDFSSIKLGKDYDYSKTTLQYLYKFLNEYLWISDLNIKKLNKSLNDWFISNWIKTFDLSYDPFI